MTVDPAMRAFRRGYTLVELLVVMAILGILAAAVMPLGEVMLRSQKERELRQALWEIRGAIDEYKRAADRGLIKTAGTESGYPPNLEALVAGVADGWANTPGQMVYFLRRLPRDPFAASDLPAAQTWRLRSYASPPGKPAPGSDVFDVMPTAEGIALDGSAYRDW
jgi:general secretion pathway protein G